MGEANFEGWVILKRFLGQPPWYEHRDDQVTLHLGDQFLTAKANALWSDPTVFDTGDHLLVSWAGNHLVLTAVAKHRSPTSREATGGKYDG